MKRYIYIDQGCCGALIPGGGKQSLYTDFHGRLFAVDGLMTEGIETCSGIVAWRGDNHMFLCHADTMTDLTNPHYGLIGWAKNLPKNGQVIYIKYHNSWGSDYYKMQIDEVVRILKTEEPHMRVSVAIALAETSKVFLQRNILRDGEPAIYSIGPPPAPFDDIERHNTPLFDYAGSIRAITAERGEKIPPILIYNDKITLMPTKVIQYYQHQKSMHQRENYYNPRLDSFIDPLIRVLRNPHPQTPPTPLDEHRPQVAERDLGDVLAQEAPMLGHPSV